MGTNGSVYVVRVLFQGTDLLHQHLLHLFSQIGIHTYIQIYKGRWGPGSGNNEQRCYNVIHSVILLE